MLHIVLLVLAFEVGPCANPYINGSVVYSFDSTYLALDSDRASTTIEDGLRGIHLTTKVFAEKSLNIRQDADSAVFYLRRAREHCPESATVQAYLYAARLLQASKREMHETLFLLDTLRLYFRKLDTLAREHPENFSVQFIAGCVLQNAPAIIDDGTLYWYRSRVYLSRLDSLATKAPREDPFFTREVRANIQLNLAHLQGKEGTQSARDAQFNGLQKVILTYPETWAAARAKRIIQEKILVAPAVLPTNFD